MKQQNKGQKGGAMGQPIDTANFTRKSNTVTGRRLSPNLYNDEEYDESSHNGKSIAERTEAEELTTPHSQPEHLGEQAISGSTPDPSSDDDTLEAAQAMGTQLDEDEEHPQELNIGKDVDTAEENLRQNH